MRAEQRWLGKNGTMKAYARILLLAPTPSLFPVYHTTLPAKDWIQNSVQYKKEYKFSSIFQEVGI